MELTYHLNDFEGPLDLLLALISKNKIDIHDIPIVSICDQYMAYLEEAERMDLEITSDFIIMASELMLIKSKMLLPGRADREDPRKELVNQLELYIATKNAAEQLRPLYSQFSGRMAKEMDEIPPEKGIPLGLDPSLLSAALNAMMARVNSIQPEPEQLITPLLTTPIVSVEEKIKEIVATLEQRKVASLFTLLKVAPDKADLLARFMGILELVKVGQILICKDVFSETPEEVIIEHPDTPSDVPEDYNATAGLTIAFMLNPDFDPETAEFSSEFESDAPVNDEEQQGNDENGEQTHES